MDLIDVPRSSSFIYRSIFNPFGLVFAKPIKGGASASFPKKTLDPSRKHMISNLDVLDTGSKKINSTSVSSFGGEQMLL